MLKCRKPLLPDWRYWPAIPFVALLAVSIAAFALAPSPSEMAAHTAKADEPKAELKKPDERLADYTWWLTVLTAGIVVTGFLQTLVLMKADSVARMGARAAMKQTVIARRQMLISGQQTEILNKQTAIQRQEFFATHRPRLEVKFVRRLGQDAEITVINTGEADAKFVAARAMLINFGGGIPPSPHDLTPADLFTLRDRFGPSDADRVVISFTNNMFSTNSAFHGDLHIFGWVIYEPDVLNPTRRTTYFGFKAPPGETRFIPLTDWDWNFIQ